MIRHDYHTRANGRPHPFTRARFPLVAMGLMPGFILFLSMAGCATVPADTWCDGLPPVYGTDC